MAALRRRRTGARIGPRIGPVALLMTLLLAGACVPHLLINVHGSEHHTDWRVGVPF